MTDKITYETKLAYEPSHWALHYPTNEDKTFIAHFFRGDMEAVFKLNGSDSRGYRSIVTIVAKEMATTLNRPSELKEKLFIQSVASLAMQVYENLGILAQVEIAGNNSHEFDPETGITHVGTKKEPSMLHAHLIGRGDPKHEFISGVPLRGPQPGQLFNMRGDGTDEGNKYKTKWLITEVEEMKAVRDAIRDQIIKISRSKEFELLDVGMICC